jgi:hypothetical protein
MMMMYNKLTTAQLLEEKSYLEQIGTPAATQLLDIMEELNNRRTAAPAAPIEISYSRNAQAVIYPEHIEFYGNERGTKRLTMPINYIYQDDHLLSFYRSEYLANGIKTRVMNALSKQN